MQAIQICKWQCTQEHGAVVMQCLQYCAILHQANLVHVDGQIQPGTGEQLWLPKCVTTGSTLVISTISTRRRNDMSRHECVCRALHGRCFGICCCRVTCRHGQHSIPDGPCGLGLYVQQGQCKLFVKVSTVVLMLCQFKPTYDASACSCAVQHVLDACRSAPSNSPF